jgi:hypothetical protein
MKPKESRLRAMQWKKKETTKEVDCWPKSRLSVKSVIVREDVMYRGTPSQRSLSL